MMCSTKITLSHFRSTKVYLSNFNSSIVCPFHSGGEHHAAVGDGALLYEIFVNCGVHLPRHVSEHL